MNQAKVDAAVQAAIADFDQKYRVVPNDQLIMLCPDCSSRHLLGEITDLVFLARSGTFEVLEVIRPDSEDYLTHDDLCDEPTWVAEYDAFHDAIFKHRLENNKIWVTPAGENTTLHTGILFTPKGK